MTTKIEVLGTDTSITFTNTTLRSGKSQIAHILLAQHGSGKTHSDIPSLIFALGRIADKGPKTSIRIIGRVIINDQNLTQTAKSPELIIAQGQSADLIPRGFSHPVLRLTNTP